MNVYLFKLVFSFFFFSDIYPGVELLSGHMVVLLLVFLRNHHIVNSVQGFPFLHILTICHLRAVVAVALFSKELKDALCCHVH